MYIKNILITVLSYLRNPWKRNLINRCRAFSGKYGIEIGGPSPYIFSLKGLFPVYVFANQIDGVNYSVNTVWEGKLAAGKNYNYFQNKYGYQYIAEATNLEGIESNKYDFLLSSHSLEHVSNPIKALFEWKRVLKESGSLILVLPDKTNTFDRKRSYTKFEHLLDDYRADMDEHDQTHMQEIKELIYFTNEPASDQAAFKERLADNFATRIAHHHVFSLELIKEMLSYTGFTVTYQQSCPPFNMTTIATKNG
jgi:ubiquinone/menaquinone biosynthesis C-methylase UbiE